MFERQVMIAGLQKQHSLLLNLIQEIETKQALDRDRKVSLEQASRRVEHNLRRLRRLKSNYFQTLS